MQNSEDGEGVTKGTVHDVPELKDSLGAAKKSDALRKRRLFLRDRNGALKLLVARRKKAE